MATSDHHQSPTSQDSTQVPQHASLPPLPLHDPPLRPLHDAPLRPLQDVHPNVPPHASSSRHFLFRPPTPYNPDFDDTYYQPPSPVSSIPTIPKLSGGNYRSWATNIELVLRRHQVWSFVRDIPPTENARSHAWDEKDLLARSEILWSCEPDIQCLLCRCTTSEYLRDIPPVGPFLAYLLQWWLPGIVALFQQQYRQVVV